jgi:hypothetical protein
MTEVTAYNNPNAPIHRQWIAYVVMDNGNLWGVYAIGATEEAAKVKIQTLWESERQKVNRIALGDKPAVFSPSPSQPTGWPSELTGEAPRASGKGQYAVGSKWVISAKGERARVGAEKAAELVANGWRYGKN